MRQAEATLSIERMPAVAEACLSALPVVLTHVDAREYPGTKGTCFGVRVEGRVGFLTAAHVVRGFDGNLGVHIPLNFRGPGPNQETAVIASAWFPPDVNAATACDMALLIPQTTPNFVNGESCAIEISNFDDLGQISRGDLFAISGYPAASDLHGFDYDSGEMNSHLYQALGQYVGPSIADGCHLVSVTTDAVGGADGLSGGPVFRLRRSEGGDWAPHLAGMIVTANSQLVHFIDARILRAAALQRLAAADGPR